MQSAPDLPTFEMKTDPELLEDVTLAEDLDFEMQTDPDLL
jgi:hypothetical protein